MILAFVLAAMAAPMPAAKKETGCQTLACHHRVGHRKGREKKLRTVRPYRSRFLQIAQCESGRRWHINTGNGFFGGLQFTRSSWLAVGGRGLPHRHPPLEQMFRGVKLMWIQGWGAWPHCS